MPQLPYGLQRTAKARYAGNYVVQPLPIEASRLAVFKTVRLGHAPVNQRKPVDRVAPGHAVALRAIRLICGEAEIHHCVESDVRPDRIGLHRGAPSPPKRRPAAYHRPRSALLDLQHALGEVILRTQPRDRPAKVRLHAVNVAKVLRMLPPTVKGDNLVKVHSLFGHAQHHRCRILPAAE